MLGWIDQVSVAIYIFAALLLDDLALNLFKAIQSAQARTSENESLHTPNVHNDPNDTMDDADSETLDK